jgi:hypothetical protein
MRGFRFKVRPPSFVIGAQSVPILLDLASGTFTRTTSGSYYSGNTSSIAWQPPNIRRYEDKGDGYGSLLLLEGARTNIFNYSRNSSANVNKAAGAMATASYAASPDGLMSGTRYVLASSQYSDFTTLSKTAGTSYAHSSFVRATAGTANWQGLVSNQNSALTATINEAWRRVDVVVTASTTANGGWIAVDGRDWTSAGGQTAQAMDVIVDMHQIESGVTFPSSFIQTDSTTDVARGADVLSFSTSSFSGAMDYVAISGTEFDWYPIYASTEAPATSPMFFMWNVGSNYFAIVANTLRAVESGATKATTSALTYGRNTKITIRVEPYLGKVTFSSSFGTGSTTGTPWEWPLASSASITSLAISPSANPAWGRFSNFRRVD